MGPAARPRLRLRLRLRTKQRRTRSATPPPASRTGPVPSWATFPGQASHPPPGQPPPAGSTTPTSGCHPTPEPAASTGRNGRPQGAPARQPVPRAGQPPSRALHGRASLTAEPAAIAGGARHSHPWGGSSAAVRSGGRRGSARSRRSSDQRPALRRTDHGDGRRPSSPSFGFAGSGPSARALMPGRASLRCDLANATNWRRKPASCLSLSR